MRRSLLVIPAWLLATSPGMAGPAQREQSELGAGRPARATGEGGPARGTGGAGPAQATGGSRRARSASEVQVGLARWQELAYPPPVPPPRSTTRIDVDGATLYVARHGVATGTPVILLHGGMGNGDHWSHQIRALARSFDVITIDSRGHGRSTRPRARPSYDAMAHDVVAVMDRLSLSRASIVGWSDGGEVALKLAIHHPSRVAGLVVFAATYDASGTKRHTRASPTFRRYGAKCRADYRRLSATPEQFDAFVRWLKPVWSDPMGITPEQLRAIHSSTLVVVGDHDEIVDREHVKTLARLIPDAKLLVLEDVSHFAHWQDPETFNAAITGFLSSVDPS